MKYFTWHWNVPVAVEIFQRPLKCSSCCWDISVTTETFHYAMKYFSGHWNISVQVKQDHIYVIPFHLHWNISVATETFHHQLKYFTTNWNISVPSEIFHLQPWYPHHIITLKELNGNCHCSIEWGHCIQGLTPSVILRSLHGCSLFLMILSIV